MKKLKLILLAFVVFFGFTLTTYAEEYSAVYNKQAISWDDKVLYEMTISSNDLANDLIFNVGNEQSSISYIDDDYLIYSENRYKYQFYDPNTHSELKEIDGEIEILIHREGLVEGRKYDVYYFDNIDNYPYTLDKEHLEDKAEVVKIDDKLYIRLVTSVLKPFGLEMKMSKEYQEELEKITDNGIYLFPAVKPTKAIEENFDFYTLFEAFDSDGHDIEIWPVDEYMPKNKIQHMTLEFKNIPGEIHLAKYKWKEETIPTHLKDKFEEIETSILNNTSPLDKIAEGHEGVYFEISDLNYINYLYNKDPQKEEFDNLLSVVNYSSELKSVFKNNNFKYYFDFRAGNNEPFFNVAFGFMSLGYNNLIYSTNFEAGYYVKQVIYIPNNTKNTDEAYIAAAKKRITDYLGTDDVQIEVAGTREQVTRDFELDNEYRNVWKKFYDEKNLSDNYYKITVNGNSGYFVFEKNNKEIQEIEFKTKDLDSDVEINTDSGSIPLDTLIEVDIIGKNHKEFKEILEKLQKDNGMIYDLKLYSETLSKYITKLDNGKFKVSIPLKDDFKNKKLKAYYITDDDKIEEYNITIENGYAVFETTHFSTYTIAESNEIPNPNTLDNITTYILLVILSTIVLLVSTVYLKKINNY